MATSESATVPTGWQDGSARRAIVDMAYPIPADQAAGDGWTVISMKDDWNTVLQQWM